MQSSKKNNPLLVVAIMVKDEELTIIKTLESFLSSEPSYFVVVDTGSKDKTIEIIANFFKRTNVIGHIRQEKFVDFAASRNKTLKITEEIFPEADFIVMPDAEWQLNNIKLLLKFCQQERYSNTPLYLITTYMQDTEFTVARLFRLRAKNRFEGVVHESPTTITEDKCPKEINFLVNSSQNGIDKSRKRWQQDLLLLTNAFNKDNTHPRTTFYLAQTYECLELFENAYETYKHRANLNGFTEENFITQYRLGYIADKLKNTNKNYTWELAMQHYLNAFNLRPQRIEPLVKIAMHYWPENIHTCYLFIKYAYDTPYPSNDMLFIEKEMYFFDRYEIMSRCAWYQQDYTLGKEATLKALNIHPEMEHLHNNLKLYQEKLQSNEELPA